MAEDRRWHASAVLAGAGVPWNISLGVEAPVRRGRPKALLIVPVLVAFAPEQVERAVQSENAPAEPLIPGAVVLEGILESADEAGQMEQDGDMVAIPSMPPPSEAIAELRRKRPAADYRDDERLERPVAPESTSKRTAAEAELTDLKVSGLEDVRPAPLTPAPENNPPPQPPSPYRLTPPFYGHYHRHCLATPVHQFQAA